MICRRQKFGVRQSSTFSNTRGNNSIHVKTDNAHVRGSSLAFSKNTTHLVVLQLTWSDTFNSGKLKLWLDPTSSADIFGNPGGHLSLTDSFDGITGAVYHRRGGFCSIDAAWATN